eukprot:2952168-Rhodomonas_salina.1
MSVGCFETHGHHLDMSAQMRGAERSRARKSRRACTPDVHAYTPDTPDAKSVCETATRIAVPECMSRARGRTKCASRIASPLPPAPAPAAPPPSPSSIFSPACCPPSSSPPRFPRFPSSSHTRPLPACHSTHTAATSAALLHRKLARHPPPPPSSPADGAASGTETVRSLMPSLEIGGGDGGRGKLLALACGDVARLGQGLGRDDGERKPQRQATSLRQHACTLHSHAYTLHRRACTLRQRA